MKIALLGAGKTGSKVAELLANNKPTIFDENNPPSLENLKGHQAIICFLPGAAFVDYIPLLIRSRIPVITGSTGFEWPDNFEQTLKKEKLSWIYAANFSLGMNLVHAMIKVLSQTDKLFEDYHFNIHEIHHTKKLDAPSGTAIAWKKWLNQDATITHDRIGDVVGTHKLTLTTPTEVIELNHIARDRAIFAAGALWACKKVCNDSLAPGLYNFSDMTLKELL